MKITGTFLDEISHDIPSQNWGPKEWSMDFDAMKKVGIDTVILIRVGYRNFITFPCNSLKKHTKPMPVYLDLVGLFLKQAERCGMDFYFGTYDSGQYWGSGEHQKEFDINREIIDEFFAKYGHSKALKGWYISLEIDAYDEKIMKIYENLTNYLRKLKKVPILMSPYVKGPKQAGKPFTFEEHKQQWEKVFTRIEGLIDIIAFQDGKINYADLPMYMKLHKELADKHKIKCWSNIESFDRDMPFRFPGIGWNKMRYKMEAAAQAGLDKLITFEFSHFMSPNSINLESRNLWDRYNEWLKK